MTIENCYQRPFSFEKMPLRSATEALTGCYPVPLMSLGQTGRFPSPYRAGVVLMGLGWGPGGEDPVRKCTECLTPECLAQEGTAHGNRSHGHHCDTRWNHSVAPEVKTAEVVEPEARHLSPLVLRFTWEQSCVS